LSEWNQKLDALTVAQLKEICKKYKIKGYSKKKKKPLIKMVLDFIKNNDKAQEFIKRKYAGKFTSQDLSTGHSAVSVDAGGVTPEIIIQMEHRLSSVEKQVAEIKSFIEKLQAPKIKASRQDISDDSFYRIVSEAYHSIGNKMGSLVTIPELTRKISKRLKWDQQRIHDGLYQLYIDGKVDLQPGKVKEGSPMRIEGNTFYWFTFR